MKFYCGDASKMIDLVGKEKKAQFDRVVAVDCAYHFSQRNNFFSDSYSYLRNGGVLGLSDFVLPEQHRSWSKTTLASLAPVFEIPRKNFLTFSEYQLQLIKVGFREVECMNMTGEVLGGFYKNWIRIFQELGHTNDKRLRLFFRVALTAMGAKAAVLGGGLDYLFIRAKR